MPHHCDSCRQVRARANYPSCKVERLCKLVDVSFILRHPSRPLSDYLDAQHAMDRGNRAARAKLRTTYVLPSSHDEFCNFILDLHRLIFGKAEPRIAGRFRVEAENHGFGGSGTHALLGADHSEIRAHIARLTLRPAQSDYAPTEHGRKQLARWAARFLEQFYRIHPFVDGNGRVGRFYVELVVEMADLWSFTAWPRSSRQRRRYIHALEYAHKHAPESTHLEAARGAVDAYGPLTHRIAKLLAPVPEELSEAEPPYLCLECGRMALVEEASCPHCGAVGHGVDGEQPSRVTLMEGGACLAHFLDDDTREEFSPRCFQCGHAFLRYRFGHMCSECLRAASSD